MRSSASMIRTHSFCQEIFSKAQFFFRGKFPFQTNCTTRAPAALAIDGVPSVLAESTTTISSANETLARQSRRLAASFLTGTSTDKGARASDCSFIELSRVFSLRAPGFRPQWSKVSHLSSPPLVHQRSLLRRLSHLVPRTHPYRSTLLGRS